MYAYVLGLAFVFLILIIVLISAGSFSVTAIVSTSTSLLTVEGILIGLSLLIEERESRMFPTFVAILAIMWSLITITLAQILAELQARFGAFITVNSPVFYSGTTLYQVFFVNVLLFIVTLFVYVRAVASFRLQKEKDT